jgi:hypothetical protein
MLESVKNYFSRFGMGGRMPPLRYRERCVCRGGILPSVFAGRGRRGDGQGAGCSYIMDTTKGDEGGGFFV